MDEYWVTSLLLHHFDESSGIVKCEVLKFQRVVLAISTETTQQYFFSHITHPNISDGDSWCFI